MPRQRAPSAASEEIAGSEVSSILQQQQHQELGSMYDYLAKIILVGPSGTGKSCLLHRFINNSFRVLSSQTIGVEFSSKIVRIGTGVNRKRIKLQLWDTAGTERFRSVSRSYYRGAAGAILVYDIASAKSLADLSTFLMDARALASPGLVCALAGNKSDLAEPAPPTTSTNTGTGTNTNPTTAYPTLKTKTSTASSLGTTTGLPDESYKSTLSGFSSSIRSRSRTTTLEGDSSGSGSGSGSGIKWTAASTSSEGRAVSAEIADRWASKNGVGVCMEVSALTGANVDELFNRLAAVILTKIELGEIDPDDPRSGIQYGDDIGLDLDIDGTDDGSSSSLRRRQQQQQQQQQQRYRKKGSTRGRGLVLSEWIDVFRPASSRGSIAPTSNRGRGCC